MTLRLGGNAFLRSSKVLLSGPEVPSDSASLSWSAGPGTGSMGEVLMRMVGCFVIGTGITSMVISLELQTSRRLFPSLGPRFVRPRRPPACGFGLLHDNHGVRWRSAIGLLNYDNNLSDLSRWAIHGFIFRLLDDNDAGGGSSICLSLDFSTKISST